MAPWSGVVLALSIVWIGGCATPPGTPSTARFADRSGPDGSVAFRAKASSLPSDANVAQGTTPDEIVEVVLPGRLYRPPFPVVPVQTRSEADRRTPEQASASDFSAFRAADPAWLRENYTADDYPHIQRLVEDATIRNMNRGVYRGYRTKTIVSRCAYKDFALVFVRYDDAKASGVIEAYQQISGQWKRTTAPTRDATFILLQNLFRNGDVVPAIPSPKPTSPPA